MKIYQLCCLNREGRIVVLMYSDKPGFDVYGDHPQRPRTLWIQRADQPAVKERKP